MRVRPHPAGRDAAQGYSEDHFPTIMASIKVIGSATLYLGDCRRILPTLRRADALVTDPPYREFPEEENRSGCIGVSMALELVKRGIVFPGVRRVFAYPKPAELGAVHISEGAVRAGWGLCTYVPILFYGPPLLHARGNPNGFMAQPVDNDQHHPAAKPLSWMEWAIDKCTLPGETVLDPFMGSATTGVAALRLGRKFVGIEIESKYFQIAHERIAEAAATQWGRGPT